MKQRVVIIGNGIAGITAARTIRKLSNAQVTVVSSEAEHFFSRTALMYWYMGHMKWEHLEPYEKDFWKKNKIDLKLAHVQKVISESKTLVLTSGEIITYDQLVLATGSNFRKPLWWQQNLEGVSGLYSKQDVEYIAGYTKGLKYRRPKIKHAIVTGGGLIGIELAEMLHAEQIEVTMVIKEPSYWRSQLPERESNLISEHIKSKGIDLIVNNTVDQIISKSNTIESVLLSNGQEISTEFLGVTIGVEPRVDIDFDVYPEINRGYKVDGFMRTTIPDVFAIGDCVSLRNPQIGRLSNEPVWYTAKMMGEVAGKNICGISEEYLPGIWFNSAKFFDLEYQVYGSVGKDVHSSLYGELKSQSVRAEFNEDDQLMGILGLGFRLRHEVANEWISKKISQSYFLNHFKEINFEPEFQVRLEKMNWNLLQSSIA